MPKVGSQHGISLCLTANKAKHVALLLAMHVAELKASIQCLGFSNFLCSKLQ